MKRELAKKILSILFEWSPERAEEEYQWLDLISNLKYDGYNEFLGGVKFIESLANWLQQFDQPDRAKAYKFVRDELVYVSTAEIKRLVGSFYYRVVLPFLLEKVANKHGIAPYEVWTDDSANNDLVIQRRKTLFLGLSDGARMDEFRRLNEGDISNEQVTSTTQLDSEKWEDLRKELRKAEGCSSRELFSTIFLIDDFTASGTSLIRQKKEQNGTQKWVGKIEKFYSTMAKLKEEKFNLLDSNWDLCIHHYLATHQAAEGKDCVHKRYKKAASKMPNSKWRKDAQFSFGHVLPEDLPISKENPSGFWDIVASDKYYDPAIETIHNRAGGSSDIRFGYGGCALPLVLEHNTPNNSIPLLWAESPGNSEKKIHAMRPLFLRKQRHT